MTVEDRLRATTRAINDTMRPVRPLNLPPSPESLPSVSPRSRGERRWPGWLGPLVAAVAVAAVAATLVAIRDIPGAMTKPAGHPAAKPSPTASGPVTDPEALPTYFVALRYPSDGLVVGETRTGKRLATVAPPAGATFVGVTGAADDRTFVLDVMSGPTKPIMQGQHTWYLLHVTSGTAQPAELTKLPIPAMPSMAEIEGIALSPDGTKLAVLYQPGPALPATGPFTLRIYSVATGALLHGWTGTDPYHGSYGYGSMSPPDNNRNLSWTADGSRLAFAYRSSASPDSSLYLRMVDLTRPANDLFADSKVILKIAVSTKTGKSAIWCDTLGITADGRTAVCGADLPKVPPTGIMLDALVRGAPWTGCSAPTDVTYPGLTEISLATRRLTQVLYQVTPECMGGGEGSVLWASPSGAAVLGSVWYTDDPSMKVHERVVLVSHGIITPLTWPGAATLLSSAAF
jgi:hypothetical protein